MTATHTHVRTGYRLQLYSFSGNMGQFKVLDGPTGVICCPVTTEFVLPYVDRSEVVEDKPVLFFKDFQKASYKKFNALKFLEKNNEKSF